MPPKATTSAKKKTLKTYEREYDEEEEKTLDQSIMNRLKVPQRGDLNEVAEFLVFCLVRSEDLVNNKYLRLGNCKKLVSENKALVNLLFKCIEEQSFVKLRNLELFRPIKHADAVDSVRASYSELFQRLSVVVGTQLRFQRDDVAANNAEIFSDSVNQHSGSTSQPTPSPSPSPQDSIPLDIQEIQYKLSHLRIYSENTPSQDRDLARDRYGEQFSLMFQPFDDDDEDAVAVESDREYASLFWLQHSYIKDAVRAAEASSSAFKASTFCSTFIHPTAHYPFLDSTLLNYKEDVHWKFPIFVHINQVCAKYTPRNDWSVVTTAGVPIIISEVVSNKNESDRYRMLLQAIALSRAGNYLLKPTSDKNFFLVAIYLAADLRVHRYIVKPVDKDKTAKVNIVEKTFNLKQPGASSHFLLEMFNLLSEMQSLAAHIDPKKDAQLVALAKDAQRMLSFSTLRTGALPKGALAGIPEGNEDEDEGNEGGGEDDEDEDEDEDNGPSHFNSDEVSEVLDQYKYEVRIIDFFHPNIALVYEKDTDNAVEFLKFVGYESSELRILYHLATLKSPHNHAIRPIRMWSVAGGTMVSLPRAGQCLSTPSLNVSNNIWGIARQLFEGVAFLHNNNIAHLDLKPDNLILSDDKRLTLIDFGASRQLISQKRLIQGRFGTRGYIAPEVKTTSWYNPFRADLYSCGIVIKELCDRAECCTDLLDISASLMNLEPKKRPTMSQILIRLNSISLEKASESLPTTVTMEARPIPISV